MPPKSKKKTPKHGRDWKQLQSEWAASGLKLAEWCRRHRIPVSSAKRYIKATEREKYIQQNPDLSPEVEKKVTALREALEGAGTNQRASLEATQAFAREIMLESMTSAFRALKQVQRPRNPGELLRVAIQSTAMFRDIRSELLQIPEDDSEELSYTNLRGFEPLWFQRDFCFDWPSSMKARGISAFVFAFVAGLGAGKSRSGAWKLRELTRRQRGIAHGIYAPTYRMLEDATLPAFFEELDAVGIPYDDQRSKKRLILYGDTVVIYRSMDKPDFLRGPNLGGAWIDEGSQMRDPKALEQITARVRHADAQDACIIWTGTPVFNWSYTALVEKAKENRVIEYKGKTADNPYNIEGYAERLLALYDPRTAKQETAGEWINIRTGQAYEFFDKQEHVLPAKRMPAFNPDLPVLLMCDFNVSPMRWEIGQSIPYNGGEEITYIFDEIDIDTTTTHKAIAEFIRRYRKLTKLYGHHKPGVVVYGDAAGRQRRSSARRTDYQIIQDALKEPKDGKPIACELKVGRANPRQDERVADVNARLRNAKGDAHLYISEVCTELIKDLERQGFLPGTRELDKTDPQVGHASDAVGYYINYEHAIRRMRYRRSR